MGEDYIKLPAEASKQAKYENLLKALEERAEESAHPIANRANLIAMLRQEFGWWWIGFYFVYSGKYTKSYLKSTNEQLEQEKSEYLSLGSFQGPPACTKIFNGSGVCGKCWEINKSIVVSNVEQFEGHIACSSNSKSEIVIPIRKTKKQLPESQQFIGLLDIDSAYLNDFNETDQYYLEKIILNFEQAGFFNDWI